MAFHPERFHLASLCAGVGGLDLGLRIAVPCARAVVYVERESYAAACLVARMEEEALHPAPIWDDLTTFDGSQWRGTVDCLTAGFPCQPWSVAGKQAGTDDERWIWEHIARIIREMGPPFVFLENVRGLVSGGGLWPVLGSLANLGYDAEWLCLKASAVGAAHQRERVFILGYARGERHERLPRPPGTQPVKAPGSKLADARRERNHAGQPLCECGGCDTPVSCEAGSELADPAVVRVERLRALCGVSGTGEGEGRLLEPAGGGSAVGYAEGARRQPLPGSVGRSLAAPLRDAQGEGSLCGWRSREERQTPGAGSTLPLFALGPRDHRWSELLARYPDLAPALEVERQLRGLADGLAGGLDGSNTQSDRLRCGGNGVVALQAAASFRELLRRFGGA